MKDGPRESRDIFKCDVQLPEIAASVPSLKLGQTEGSPGAALVFSGARAVPLPAFQMEEQALANQLLSSIVKNAIKIGGCCSKEIHYKTIIRVKFS